MDSIDMNTIKSASSRQRNLPGSLIQVVISIVVPEILMVYCTSCGNILSASNPPGVDTTAVMLVECKRCRQVFSMDELRNEILCP